MWYSRARKWRVSARRVTQVPSVVASLSPLRGLPISHCAPTAGAVGCILSPLRGLQRVVSSTFPDAMELRHRLLRDSCDHGRLSRHFRAGLSHAADSRLVCHFLLCLWTNTFSDNQIRPKNGKASFVEATKEAESGGPISLILFRPVLFRLVDRNSARRVLRRFFGFGFFHSQGFVDPVVGSLQVFRAAGKIIAFHVALLAVH